MAKRIAVITARGGSKRIPRKNIRLFCDHPIIHYPIQAAMKSGLFDEIMVSTDDLEIAKVARDEGAKVPFLRSNETSGDQATTLSVIREVLLEYKKLGQEFDEYCCIYPTAPLLTAETLRRANRLLEKSVAGSVIPVARYSYPIQRALRIVDGGLRMASPQYAFSRSQDLEPHFHDVGQFYMGKTANVFHLSSLFDGHPAALEVPEIQSQDIDEESDWEIAELKYKILMKTE